MGKHDDGDRVTLEEARAALLALAQPTAEEEIPSEAAVGRVTAVAICARLSSPHYRAAAMDGIALASSATRGATPSTPRLLREIAAGDAASATASADVCTVVDTGNALPDWADAVVRNETTRRDGGSFVVSQAVPSGRDVRAIGEDVAAGAPLLPRGHRIRPYDLGALLATGVSRVRVRRRPRVAILATGGEIVEPGGDPAPGEVIEYNSRMLAGAVAEWGGEAIYLGIERRRLAVARRARATSGEGLRPHLRDRGQRPRAQGLHAASARRRRGRRAPLSRHRDDAGEADRACRGRSQARARRARLSGLGGARVSRAGRAFHRRRARHALGHGRTRARGGATRHAVEDRCRRAAARVLGGRRQRARRRSPAARSRLGDHAGARRCDSEDPGVERGHRTRGGRRGRAPALGKRGRTHDRRGRPAPPPRRRPGGALPARRRLREDGLPRALRPRRDERTRRRRSPLRFLRRGGLLRRPHRAHAPRRARSGLARLQREPRRRRDVCSSRSRRGFAESPLAAEIEKRIGAAAEFGFELKRLA